jgi:phospholipase C
LFFLHLLLTGGDAHFNKIKHIVVLMMENRSFDHLLGWLKSKSQNLDGLTGKENNLLNPKDEHSKKVYVNQDAKDRCVDDPRHGLDDTTLQIYGKDIDPAKHGDPKMNGFVYDAHLADHSIENPMSMFTIKTAPIINTLALDFAVFDHWHCSVPGPTDPNRAFVMSGTSRGRVDNFDGHLWKQQSYFDWLGHRNISWNAFYDYNLWAIYYFEDMWHEDNRKHIFEIEEFFENVGKNKSLAQFTFLQPRMSTCSKGPPNWQHPDASVSEGEKLIKRVYETLRGSKFWEETAFILSYDEHGGFYDLSAPPQIGVGIGV